MTHPTPWRVFPPWGWVGTASAGLVGPSPRDWTLRQSPHARRRCGLHWRGCFRLESGPDPHRHWSPPGHHLRLQRHPREPPASSSSRGASSSTWEGSVLLLDSWPLLVA